MNIKEVKDLIQEILLSDISEFELEHTGTKVRLKRGFGPSESAISVQALQAPVSPPAGIQSKLVTDPVPQPPSKLDLPSEEDGLHYIISPIVGTFYRAPSPGADPYVKIGEIVDEGTVLCVVEAMKLMNEIPSDVAGEVVRIFVENSHPVEFGQKLFGIRLRK